MGQTVRRRWRVGMTRIALGAWMTTAFAIEAAALQGPTIAPQHYDIISVKPNKSGKGGWSWGGRDNTYQATNVTLKFLLENAYDIRGALLINVPKWGDSDHWDIQGKISDYDPALAKKMTKEQDRGMLQELLATAFHVRAHRETKVLPVYELVVAKDGVKMAENLVKDTDPDAKGRTGSIMTNDGKIEALGITTDQLAHSLQGIVERNVIDKTGLTGKYDFKLKWTPEHQGATKLDDDAATSIFAAVQEQLGLKLQPAKAPVETLVVDAAELPSEN